MTQRIKLSDPAQLHRGDRVFIDDAYTYTVTDHPTVPHGTEELVVEVQYPDGGLSRRVFPVDVSWDDMDIEVER